MLHLWIKMRHGRKSTTLLEGMSTVETLSIEQNRIKLLSSLKKSLSCNGYLVDSNSLCLNGDQRAGVKQFLVENKIIVEDKIMIHGF